VWRWFCPGAAGEFAFDGREDAFDQGALSIEIAREVLSHLSADSGRTAAGEAFGGDDAIGFQLIAIEGVVAFRVEFGVGQHAANRSVLLGLSHQHGQRGLAVPGSLSCALSEDDLAIHIDHRSHFIQCFQLRCLLLKYSTWRMK